MRFSRPSYHGDCVSLAKNSISRADIDTSEHFTLKSMRKNDSRQGSNFSAMNAPIILIHYGNSSFLPYVVQLIKRFNPRKELLFLGDESNDYLREFGATHLNYSEYAYGPELQCFDRLYPRIENPRYGKRQWANFIIRRWFIINQFTKSNHIDRFWTFDSDNYLLTDLAKFEDKFSCFDCTSQCKGNCLNGFVPHREIVQLYVEKINELIGREGYAEDWQRRYRRKPDLFYTEMEAFDTFVKEGDINSHHLAGVVDGSAFEDSITYIQDGMEMYEKKIKGRYVKKLYLKSGEIFCRHLASGQFVKMNNLNLSWMPKYVFPLLFGAVVRAPVTDDFVPVDLLKAPVSYHIKYCVARCVPVWVRDRIRRGAYWV